MCESTGCLKKGTKGSVARAASAGVRVGQGESEREMEPCVCLVGHQQELGTFPVRSKIYPGENK